jgi:leucyl aminopeptidase
MELTGSNKDYKELSAQALAVPVFADEKADSGILQELDAATGGLVASVLESGEMKGKEGEAAYIHLPAQGGLQAQRLLLLGVGAKDDYKGAQVAQAAGASARSLRGRKATSVAFVPRSEDTAAAAEGVITSLFDTDKYKTKGQDEKGVIESFAIVQTGADEAALNAAVRRGRDIGESINLTRELANEPGNEMTPSDMAERARAIAQECGLEVDILDEARMEQEGMGALLGVSRGSEEPAKLIVLKYTPANAPESDGLLAFIGKGITFDTGGISLKPAENMEAMKYDMSGGAAVLGAMRAIGLLKPAVSVLGLVPVAENMPSGRATKPGDVHISMSGKTIEVINTDAEGRLVLCDAITYARKLGATRIVDMATLTGAVVIALGDVNTGLLGNDQALIDQVIAAGKEAGEKFWQLPLDKEYTKQLKSDIADLKNVGGRRAGTITAAAFLKEFAEGIEWAHMDIAGTAWADDAKPYRAKGPTGVPVRTLLKFVGA